MLRLEGIYPPIPTSFDAEGNVFPKGIIDNLNHLNQFDLRGYVVLGSNGEYVLLTEAEKLLVFETARKAIPKNKLMIAGVGCESTNQTANLAKKAAEIGADAVLVITPSYYKNRMTPAALTQHYRSVADASPIPVILYNMPACTGIDLSAEIVAGLSEHPNIIGIKDSGGNLIKMGNIVRLTGPEFQTLAGSASFLLPAFSVGAVGGILALANIAPEKCLTIKKHFRNSDMEKARELQVHMIPVNNAITREGGVPALKAAMDMLELYGGPVRPPLLPHSDDEIERLKDILREGEILK